MNTVRQSWLRRIDPVITCFMLTLVQMGLAAFVGFNTYLGIGFLLSGLFLSPVLAAILKVWQYRGRRE